MEIKNRIEVAKANLRKAENAKTVAETEKVQAEKQLKEVEEKMEAEGVTPSNIHAVIVELETQIEADLEKVEGLIPKV